MEGEVLGMGECKIEQEVNSGGTIDIRFTAIAPLNTKY